MRTWRQEIPEIGNSGGSTAGARETGGSNSGKRDHEQRSQLGKEGSWGQQEQAEDITLMGLLEMRLRKYMVDIKSLLDAAFHTAPPIPSPAHSL